MFLYNITLASKPTGTTTIKFVGCDEWEISIPPRRFTGGVPATASFASIPPPLPLTAASNTQIQVNWRSEAGSGVCKNSVKIDGADIRGTHTQTLTSTGEYVSIRVGGIDTYEI